MPVINTCPNAGNLDITNNKVIQPGAYGTVTLGGIKTLTFDGTGTYIFSTIKNSGTANKFVCAGASYTWSSFNGGHIVSGQNALNPVVNGGPGKVNISASTFEQIKHKYQCTHRGKIYAKNVGDVDMYFVDKEILN